MTEDSNLLIKILEVGYIGTNCYLVINTDTKEAVVIDPGGDADRIISALNDAEVRPAAIFLTHGHMDHIFGVNDLKAAFPDAVVYASVKEQGLLTTPSLNRALGPIDYTVEADRLFGDDDAIEAAGFTFTIIHTPGHSAGSVCYYLPDDKVLFAGDTLFRGSYGRYDLPTGSFEEIIASVRFLLSSLPEEVVVLCGHGPATTIAMEKIYNQAQP